MHSDWFNGIEILQSRWQHGEKVGYCYPSKLEKTLCKWDIYVPLVTKGLNCCTLILLSVKLNKLFFLNSMTGFHSVRNTRHIHRWTVMTYDDKPHNSITNVYQQISAW